ncbi:hypothetical protein B0H17DRAFT_1203198 [Mycena rosella]|uniref:Uncharacterized protein n=1 Tax=Mycena rosella TaxID=1033263 RepID=A0AAD7DBU4_MYCRO|nr:hypothetical protein B0H17DRAFT_1203198 [Mycena rosella]
MRSVHPMGCRINSPIKGEFWNSDASDFELSTSPRSLEMFNPYAQGGWTNTANPNAASNDTLQLYSAGLGAPQIYARVFREDEEVALELTQEAVQIGLLELCVTAALLLQSGRDID